MCKGNATNFFCITIYLCFFPGHQLSFAIPLVKIGEIFEKGNRVTQTEREMEH